MVFLYFLRHACSYFCLFNVAACVCLYRWSTSLRPSPIWCWLCCWSEDSPCLVQQSASSSTFTQTWDDWQTHRYQWRLKNRLIDWCAQSDWLFILQTKNKNAAVQPLLRRAHQVQLSHGSLLGSLVSAGSICSPLKRQGLQGSNAGPGHHRDCKHELYQDRDTPLTSF